MTYPQPQWQPQPPAGYTVPSGTQPPPPMALVPLAPNGQPLAGFGDRLLAFLLDLGILFAVNLLFVIPGIVLIFLMMSDRLATVRTDPVTGQPQNVNLIFLLAPLLLIELGLLVLTSIASYVYHVELNPKQRGRTIGKRTMKLAIIRLSDPQAPITRGIAAKRWAMQNLVGILVPGFSYLDGLWQLWDKPNQQCLHDKVADTVVVKVSA